MKLNEILTESHSNAKVEIKPSISYDAVNWIINANNLQGTTVSLFDAKRDQLEKLRELSKNLPKEEGVALLKKWQEFSSENWDPAMEAMGFSYTDNDPEFNQLIEGLEKAIIAYLNGLNLRISQKRQEVIAKLDEKFKQEFGS